VTALPAAAQNYYDVEVIIFELLNSNAVADQPPPDTDAAQPATTEPAPAPAPAPAEQKPDPRFEPLTPDRMQLNTEFQRLRNSKAYRPLVHLAWRQQVLGPRMSVARPIMEQTPSGTFTGSLKVYTETFLHVALDLTFEVPGEGIYRLRDGKRVRSKETHYFDHPRFGVLLRITPPA
jgi:hypothetical protein